MALKLPATRKFTQYDKIHGVFLYCGQFSPLHIFFEKWESTIELLNVLPLFSVTVIFLHHLKCNFQLEKHIMAPGKEREALLKLCILLYKELN
jgi:hypothetical protein